jgi:uncharacterized protein (DUF2336 family)
MRNSLIIELESALKSGSSEKRVDTLRRITSLFLSEADRLTEQQIGVFDEILVRLIERIETKALVQLGTTLAPINNAPIEVIRHLSRHDEIEVAGPVLTQSSRLTENDLIEVAHSKGQGHLLAMSKRASLPETVTDVLVERGDRSVFTALANNSEACFSQSGFATLVKKSENDESLAEEVGLRLDIPSELLKQLLSRASDLVRSRLLAAASSENRDKIQSVLAGVVGEVSREAAAPYDYTRVDGEVHELNRQGKLNEQVLAEFAREHKHAEIAATLALFCGTKSEIIEGLLKNASYEGLIVACKAAKISWSTAQLVLQARVSYHLHSDNELAKARDDFLELSQANAQRTMRFMMTQIAAKKSELGSRAIADRYRLA